MSLEERTMRVVDQLLAEHGYRSDDRELRRLVARAWVNGRSDALREARELLDNARFSVKA